MFAVCPLARWMVMAASFGFALTSSAQELAPELLYQSTVPSVLTLKIETRSGDRYVGAAFLAIKEGIAVTAWHVVHDAVKVTAKYADGTSFDVPGYLDKDETKDIALIPVRGHKDRRLLKIAHSLPLVGSRTYVIGSPKGYEFSISDGLLSQVQKVDGFDQYQVSCPFSPGNSGGPILNSKGEVVGIAAWTRNGAQNVNFATPASEVFTLKPGQPLKLWKSNSSRRAMFRSFDKKRSAPEAESAETAAELKKIFQKSAGEEVTVVVIKDGHQERFTLTVPPDFVE